MIDIVRKVVAVIVSYNPDQKVFLGIVNNTALQVEHVIIVDNGSNCSTLTWLELLTSKYANVSIIKLQKNEGIATAQNEGIKKAYEINCSHVLFLDHDSIPDLSMVKSLLKTEKELLDHGVKVGAVGPTCVDRRTNTASGFVKKNKIFISRIYPEKNSRYVETDFLISSGTLVNCSALKKIGLMNDGYFIDHVDTEWCFRAISLGYKLYGSGDAILNHSLGENVVRIWFGRWREIPQHNSFRYYYIFRNTLSMIRYTKMSFSWKVAHLYRLTLFLMFFGIIGNGRKKRLDMIYMGIRDHFKHIDGKLGQ